MSKSLRSFVLVATTLFAAAVPSLHANRTGCDPHPQVVAAPVSQFAVIVYTVMSSLSF